MGDRQIPNPTSKILASAHIGGAGAAPPPGAMPPPGYSAVLLWVPAEHISGKTMLDIQADIGLPWSTTTGEGCWLDEVLEQADARR